MMRLLSLSSPIRFSDRVPACRCRSRAQPGLPSNPCQAFKTAKDLFTGFRHGGGACVEAVAYAGRLI